jgi:aminoglycoside phosphotransferase (APT) family kinase protein
MENFVTQEILQRIWDANNLGVVQTMQFAKRGMNNLATVVNDTYVIRFDVLDVEDVAGVCRYTGEQLAYERLRVAGIPAPEVVALDLSKSLIPYHYIILTKIDGIPLIDDWPNFSEAQQAEAGRAAGRYLAMMHNISLGGFGKLLSVETDPLPSWFDHVEQFFERYAQYLLAQNVIDTPIYARMRTCLDQMRPVVDAKSDGRLVHGDYQFENLLHRDGIITGIIDFEWGISGDPVWDFRLDEQWDSDCPGSTAYIYEGYIRLRPLAPDHHMCVWLYKLLFHLDSVDMYTDSGQKAEQVRFYDEMMKALVALEAGLER